MSIAALLTPLARYWWFADLIANLRVQLVIGMTFALVCLLILRSWRWLVVLAALTGWQVIAFSSAFSFTNGCMSLRLIHSRQLAQVTLQHAIAICSRWHSDWGSRKYTLRIRQPSW
ncbi:MAG: hypothetical protein ABI557_05435 [Aureliella sp.]